MSTEPFAASSTASAPLAIPLSLPTQQQDTDILDMCEAGRTGYVGDITPEMVKDMLFTLPQDEYATDFNQWFKIACILKRAGVPFDVFDLWSSDSPNYDPQACRDKWEEIDVDAPVKATLGTLVYEAKKHGYQFPPPKNEAQQLLEGLTALLKPKQPEPKAEKRVFRIYDDDEFMALDLEFKWLVREFLVCNDDAVILGASKTLKTTFAVFFLLAVASGKPLLDRWEVTRKRVLVMSGESGLRTLQETARRLRKTLGITESLKGWISWCDELPRLDNFADLSAIRDALKAIKPEVLLIDPLSKALNGMRAENLYAMNEQLYRISQMCKEHGCMLIACHHHNKHFKGDRPTFQDGAMSGVDTHFRQWINIWRPELYVPGSGYHHLLVDVGGSAGHSQAYDIEIYEGQPGRKGNERVFSIEILTQQEADAIAEQEAKRISEETVEAFKAAVMDYVQKHEISNRDDLTNFACAKMSGKKPPRKEARLILDEMEANRIVYKEKKNAPFQIGDTQNGTETAVEGI